MAALKVLIAAGALLWAVPGAADPLDYWSSYIEEASVRFGVPAEWIRRVMRAESGGRTSVAGNPIVSPAGAMGLMQLMPGTWREMRALHGLGRDPHDPRDNILAGTAYLRAMHDRFGYPGLFAAYNAGPARHAQHLANRRALPAETVAYIAKVTGTGAPHGAGPPGGGEPAASPLFFLRDSIDRRGERIAGEAVSDGLFVPLEGEGR